MAKRTTLPEPEWTGWSRGVKTVEVERLTRRGDTYAVDAVRLDGSDEVVGHVVGRPDALNGRRWWDYVTEGAEAALSADVQVSLVYGVDDRRTAVNALVEAVRPLGGRS